ncbi:hypothetical protein [Sunxiuqinia rutila]|uniref:hypothetical protein n=1 Tax=Sunxiuqinia rutila TaxID=1397841 RepID=UPI003D36B66D
MINQRHLGKLCPYSKDCPVYQEELKIERVSSFLIKNVFCNRGYKGWKNCERFKLADEGLAIPTTATPYKVK